MVMESAPQVLENCPEAPGIASVQICLIWICGNIPSEFLIPAGVLDTRQEVGWDDRKHLKRQTGKKNTSSHPTLKNNLKQDFCYTAQQRTNTF